MIQLILSFVILILSLCLLNTKRESFALPGDVTTDINALDNNKVYTIGTLKPDAQIKTINAAIGGGANCLQFPQIAYKIVPVVPAECSVANGTDQSAVNAANVEGNYTFAPRQARGIDIKSSCFSDVNTGILTSGIAGGNNNSCASEIKSPSGNHRLVTQTDGNLVLYRQDGSVVWDSKTNGKGVGPWTLKVQSDGHLVLYDKNGTTTWWTGRYGAGVAPFKLTVQDDGNLVETDKNGWILWSLR